MAEWSEPKSDYKKTDPVTPEIFNGLAENEKHLKEISCHIEVQSSAGVTSTVSGIVLVEV